MTANIQTEPISRTRRDAWRANAIATDAHGPDAFNPEMSGRVVRRVRGFATMPTHAFRRMIAVPISVLIVSQVVIGALSNADRTIRAVVSGVFSFASGISAVLLATMLLGRYVRVTPKTFRKIAAFSGVLLAFIILTGSAVRLTGSGLGCPDWPTCKEGRVVPASGTHAQIEFGNRVVTGLCLMAAAVGVLTAFVRRGYRRDLVHYGLLVSALLFGNAIVGGLTVLFDLRPQFVMSHFLLAIASLATGMVLFHRAGENGGSSSIWGRDRIPAIGGLEVHLGRALAVLAFAVLFMGAIVTGSGPHGGDPEVVRFGYSMRDVSLVHSGLVWATLLTAVVLAVRVVRSSVVSAVRVRRRVGALLGVMLVQGAIGYIQYLSQVPAGLVQLHVIGATTFWVVVLWVRAGLTTVRVPSTPTL